MAVKKEIVLMEKELCSLLGCDSYTVSRSACRGDYRGHYDYSINFSNGYKVFVGLDRSGYELHLPEVLGSFRHFFVNRTENENKINAAAFSCGFRSASIKISPQDESGNLSVWACVELLDSHGIKWLYRNTMMHYALTGVESDKECWTIDYQCNEMVKAWADNSDLFQVISVNTDDTEELHEGSTGTKSIKFFWNGIKINGDKTLIRCLYSLDNRHDGRECVTIYARDYSGRLPGDMFPVENRTDSMTDYFETDRADLFPGHPLYAYARAAAIKAELRNEKYYRADTCVTSRAAKMRKLLDYKRELETLPDGQPTAADVEAVHAMNLAAETARLANEKEQEQKEREAVLAMRNAGRVYIEKVAAAHPIRDGAPVVTIQWSEHAAFYSWEENELKLSVAAAEIILKHYDELRAEHNAAAQIGGYDKTSFLIEYTDQNRKPSTYEGRYDLGDNDGGLIAHIRAFAESKRCPGYFYDEDAAAEISALADLLEEHTAAGRVVSITVAPWIEEAVRARREAAQRHMRETMETLEMLTDEQLTAAVLISPRDNPDVARFFLQELSRRDAKKALAALRAWKEGLGPGDIDRIA